MKSPKSLVSDGSVINGLLPVDTVADMIRAGAALNIAGRKEALDRLPAGCWIAGTSPYFMTAEGGRIISDDEVFVTDLAWMGEVTFTSYGVDELDRISANAPDHGFALTVIPAGSSCHARFAENAANYPYAFLRPTVGWIAGYDLDEAGACAWVYDGTHARAYSDRAVVAHVDFREGADVLVEIVNIFAPDGAERFRFEEAGFVPEWCNVNGKRQRFADYVAERGREAGDLPLIGNFGGAHINASLKSFDAATGRVELYAPVFPGVDYQFAAPIADYAEEFRNALARQPHDGAMWSCNCILNFLFGKLEGVSIGGMAGPVTFGEIAYQLLNQTMVIVRQV